MHGCKGFETSVRLFLSFKTRDKLVTSLGKAGLKLNAAKTKVLTTQAQPPKTLRTRAGLGIEVLVGPVIVP